MSNVPGMSGQVMTLDSGRGFYPYDLLLIRMIRHHSRRCETDTWVLTDGHCAGHTMTDRNIKQVGLRLRQYKFRVPLAGVRVKLPDFVAAGRRFVGVENNSVRREVSGIRHRRWDACGSC